MDLGRKVAMVRGKKSVCLLWHEFQQLHIKEKIHMHQKKIAYCFYLSFWDTVLL